MTGPLNSSQLVLRPGIIELSWGQPDATLLPAAALSRAAEVALAETGADALAYGANSGPGTLLAWLRARLERAEHKAVPAEEIVITAGNSEALDQICTLGTQPGDVALVESPTYHLAARILSDHPLELLPVPVDDEGLNVAAVEAALMALRRQGRRARLLYTIPTFHNPTGVMLSAERRQALVALAAAENVLIVEDDVYRELAYDAPAAPSLWSQAPPGTVARLGSFAKSLAPGLRLGWITGPAELVQRITNSGLRESGGGASHFTAMVVAAFCSLGLYDDHVAGLRAAYRARRDALLGALAEHMPPGVTWTRPGGGFFVWVTLPAGLDARPLLAAAEAAGMSYLPGAHFHLDGRGPRTLRLAFSLYGPDELAQGGRLLAAVLAKHLS
jgi:2-aminoadipate transaminase